MNEETFPVISAEQYANIARGIFAKPNRKCPNKFKTLDKEIQESLIGASYDVCAEIWNMIEPHTKHHLQGTHPKHLLWALLFLKVYSKLPVLSRLVGGVENAEFSKKSWLYVEEIKGLKQRVVSQHRLFVSPIPELRFDDALLFPHL